MQDPDLFGLLKAASSRLQSVTPLSEQTRTVLQEYYNMTVPEVCLLEDLSVNAIRTHNRALYLHFFAGKVIDAAACFVPDH